MKAASPYSRITSSLVTPSPNVMHTSNKENGVKNSLIRKRWSALHHLVCTTPSANQFPQNNKYAVAIPSTRAI